MRSNRRRAPLTGAVFSPDGRWVAYASREGRASSAVYVQPFPPTGAKYQISKNADDGHHPVWSPDGAELLFTPGKVLSIERRARHHATELHVRRGHSACRAVPGAGPEFRTAVSTSARGWPYFLGLIDAAQTQSGAPAAQQIQVVLNWFEELKARVPAR